MPYACVEANGVLTGKEIPRFEHVCFEDLVIVLLLKGINRFHNLSVQKRSRTFLRSCILDP
jgi:hypothetical protein